MKGQEIILSNNPGGRFLEGKVSGTPYPGTVMEIVPSTNPVGGRHSWRAYQSTADGKPTLIAVLLPDDNQGGLYSAPYVSGTRCRLYCPIPGEELNMLVLGEPGTSSTNVVNIGDKLGVDNPTGKLIANSNFGSVPFVALEKVTEVPVDTDAWVWCMFSGQ